MGMPAVRVTDMHVCPMVTVLVPHVGGPVCSPTAPQVLVCFLPAAGVSAMAVCVGPPDDIVVPVPTVLFGPEPAAQLSSTCAHGGTVIAGAPTVLVGP